MSEGADFLDETFNVGLQIATGGLVGVEGGQFKEGITTKGLKKVTGAEAAEEANELAREQFEQDKARIRKQREEDIALSGKRQVAASKGAARARGKVSGDSITGTGTPAVGSQAGTKDFLGL